MKPAFALVALTLLLAGCAASDPDRRVPIPNTAQMSTPSGLGTVVVGVLIRNPKKTPFLGVIRPMWAGWIAYDQQTQRRAGKTMLLLGEDCAGLTSLSVSVPASNSNACTDTQYRIINIEPGAYALAWTFHDFMLKRFVNFRTGGVTFDGRSSFLNKYSFSDEALVTAGAYTFTVAAGEVVYIGDVRFDFEGENSIRAAIGEGRPEEARAYLAPTGLADRMIARAATILKTAPPSSADSPAAASP